MLDKCKCNKSVSNTPSSSSSSSTPYARASDLTDSFFVWLEKNCPAKTLAARLSGEQELTRRIEALIINLTKEMLDESKENLRVLRSDMYTDLDRFVRKYITQEVNQ